ncbi:MAG: glycosyltransferase family 4 protein [Anaerolineae bacterium]|nr:glycosyltransferase family 4 protein [Anaerolineae bacterium]
MKLALLTYDFAPDLGGVQTYLYEIARRLAASHEVHIVAPRREGRPAPSGLHYPVARPLNAPGIWQLLRALHPDRVIVGHTHPQLLLPAAATRRPFIAVAHGNDYRAAQRRWHRPLFNALLRRADPLVTTTATSASRLTALGLPPPRVIFPGTDAKRFRPAGDRPASPLRLLTVARLVAGKGIATLIAALPALLPDFPELTYTVAGAGPDRERLQKLAERHGVARSVQFAGPATGAALVALYQQSHLFVMPAREEGFGIVYLEAAACGLPVVAGRSGGAVEAVREGITGYLVPPDDPAALAATLRRLLADEELRQRMGAAGRQWVESEMNWDRAAREFAALLASDG